MRRLNQITRMKSLEPRVSVQNKHWMRGGIEEEMGMGMVMMTVEMVMIVMMMVVVTVVISPCLF